MNKNGFCMEYKAKGKPKDNMPGENWAQTMSNYSIDNIISNHDKIIVENEFSVVSLGIKNINILYRKINVVNFAII